MSVSCPRILPLASSSRAFGPLRVFCPPSRGGRSLAMMPKLCQV